MPEDAQISAEVEQIFQKASPDIEVRVRMVNINHGHSHAMLSTCKPLGEYAWFVAQVRKAMSSKPTGIGNAIDQAIDEMPNNFEIKKFITMNRAEVKDMCLTEYNEAETMAMLQKEARQEGIHEAMLLNIKNLMDGMGWTAEKAMDTLKIPLNQRSSLYISLSKNI